MSAQIIQAPWCAEDKKVIAALQAKWPYLSRLSTEEQRLAFARAGIYEDGLAELTRILLRNDRRMGGAA